MGSLSHTASTMSRAIAVPSTSEPPVTRRNLRSNASKSGGEPKARNAISAADIYLSWLTQVGARATCRAWKHGIQHKLCSEHDLAVTVADYPSGASKWNPIEHRLFSEISKHWAGRPLDSFETILNYLRTTTTKLGLKVKARLVKKQHAKALCANIAETLRPLKLV